MSALESVWMDVRFGARALRKAPGFAAVAVLTLALGIGANTAVFSVVKAVLLAPLPYDQPDRAVTIWSRWKNTDKTWVSDREVLDYRERSRALAEVAAWAAGQANLTGGSADPERVGSAGVTINLFSTLGARAAVGRTFVDGEDQPGRDRVAIISHGVWQRRYGGDPAIVGRTIELDGRSSTVVGVMPADFRLPTDYSENAAEPTQVWQPYRLDPSEDARGSHGLYAVGRLAAGATPASASADLARITARLTAEGRYEAASGFTAFALPMDDDILGAVRPAIVLLSAAVAFLLLIACANVANLLLARGETRQREIAVRCAVGAGHLRVARQLFTESLLLSALGTAFGLAVAWAGVRVLAAWNLEAIPRVGAVRLDASALAFAAIATLLTSVLFSLAPVIRALRPDLTGGLKEGGQTSTASGHRLHVRDVIVVGEIALAVLLAIGAGLMVRSLWNLQRIDLGFNPDRVLTLRVSLPEATYPAAPDVVRLFDRLLERVRTLPGVEQAGAVRSLPLASTIGDWGLDVEGFVESPGNRANGDWQVVTPGALEAMGERLVRGRLFTEADTADAGQVAVVNQTMARRYWPDGNPIGRRIRMGSNAGRPWITVVGIVADVRHNRLDGPSKEKFYRPHAQFANSTGFAPRSMTLVVRASTDPLSLAGPIRQALARLDRRLPVADVRTMDEVVAAAVTTARFTGFLLALFAALAMLLSAIGIYGVLSYLVSARTREIAIRMALGATGGDVLRQVLRQGAVLGAAGIALGTAAAAGLTRLMQALLRGVTATDPATFATIPVALVVVALAASAIPAWRATRVDPIVTIRSE